MFKLSDERPQHPVIKVVGVGGGGCNTINFIREKSIEGVEYIAANTDLQCLRESSAENTLQLGAGITGGKGAGGKPEVGRNSALEDSETIRDNLSGSDMVFITAGMGGGTGTGAAPVFSDISRTLGILSVAVVTRPFPFEGGERMEIAEKGIQELRAVVDSLIVIPNEKLLTVLPKDISIMEAFAEANGVLYSAVQGIAELITRVGLINLDFSDIKTVMSEMGDAVIGAGTASGEKRAIEAANAAIHNPLLEDVDLCGARGILVNITANEKMGINELQEIGESVKALAAHDATIMTGTVIDESMGDDLKGDSSRDWVETQRRRNCQTRRNQRKPPADGDDGNS